jgi:hypothetical protein
MKRHLVLKAKSKCLKSEKNLSGCSCKERQQESRAEAKKSAKK